MGIGAGAAGAAGAGVEVAGVDETGGVIAAVGTGFGVGTGAGTAALLAGDALAPGFPAPFMCGDGLGTGVGVLALGVFLLSNGDDVFVVGWVTPTPMFGTGATGRLAGDCWEPLRWPGAWI